MYEVGYEVDIWDGYRDGVNTVLVNGVNAVHQGWLVAAECEDGCPLLFFQHKDYIGKHTASVYFGSAKDIKGSIPMLKDWVAQLEKEYL